MRAVGDRLRAAGVATIYLVHGTFVGADAWGALAALARVYPPLGEYLRPLAKDLADAMFGDRGNYTLRYAQVLEESLNGCLERGREGEGERGRFATPTSPLHPVPPSSPLPLSPSQSAPIAVRRFLWSSENHHLGRADAAVRLLDELARASRERPGRLLLWGHSHAGNVFALLTNLLGGDDPARGRFFEAAEIHYRRPLTRRVDLPVWPRVAARLASGELADLAPRLDLVTFGTPIRYGWETAGYKRLLHVVHHRPCETLPPYRAPFPPTVERVARAADGDYIQQFGIAGTNLPPAVFQWRAYLAERRLCALVQAEIEPSELLARLRAGCRVADEGTTLLVDYGPPPDGFAQHLAGHAVYTQLDWQLFHAEQVAAALYAAGQSKGSGLVL